MTKIRSKFVTTTILALCAASATGGAQPSVGQQPQALTDTSTPVAVQTRFIGLNKGTAADLSFRPTQISRADTFEAWVLSPTQLKELNLRLKEADIQELAAPRLTTTSGTAGEVFMGQMDGKQVQEGFVANVHPTVSAGSLRTVLTLTKVDPNPAGKGGITNFAVKAAFRLENGGGVLLHGKSMTTNMVLVTVTTNQLAQGVQRKP